MSDLGWYAPKQKWSDVVESDELWDKYQALEARQLVTVRALLTTWLTEVSAALSESRREEIIHRLTELSFHNRADVYFFRAAPSNLIKIGSSHDVRKRIVDVRFRSGMSALTCLAHTPGGSGLEHLLHRVFRHDREDGEWFRESPELLKLIEMFAAMEAARQ